MNRDFAVFRCHYIGPSVWHSLQEQQYVVNDQLRPFEVTTNGTHKVTDSDPSDPIEVTTNGTHKVTEAEPPNPADEAPQALHGSSVDERLDALLQMIRTWDWRTAPVTSRPAATREAAPTSTVRVTAGPPPAEMAPPTSTVPVTAGPPPAEAAVSTTPPPLTTPAPSQVRQDSDPPTQSTSPVQSIADTQLVVVGRPRHARFEPSSDKPEDAPVEVTSSSAPAPDPATIPEFEFEPVAEPEPDHFLARMWSQHRFREAVFGLAAVVVVLLIIAGIRLIAGGNTGSGDLSPTTTVTRPASQTVHHVHVVVPISAAELAQYEGYADGLQQANTVTTKAIAGAGRAPTPSQLAPVITSYGSALNLYDFQLHFIQWPASMQTAIEADHAQLKALMSFMQSFNIVTPSGMGPWLAQFHARATSAQTGDNVVRQDLGLPSSSSFP
ncbi:MAG: hypothetical protein ACLPYY_08600 [Acidimicrobiales bacterium]